MGAAKALLRGLGLNPGAVYRNLSRRSIEAATREQGLAGLRDQLRAAVPDLRGQYTTSFDEAEYVRYWEPKMRGLHAWQVRFILDALDVVGGDNLVLADIGDSSGNHAAYVRAVAPAGRVGRVVSVNLDPVAVDKVRAKGFEAVQCRAEELDLEAIRPDLFLSFEMVEHLTDPVRFLHALASRGSAEHLLMTVPYRRDSRFGGHHLRLPDAVMPGGMTAEEVHVFELNPADWLLLARFGGYRPVMTRTYWQYPRRGPLRALAPVWRRLDFEGFFGVLLRRDLTVANKYADW
ncbi:MAG: methyltransferase domain-containing protein [Rhodobacterales bacterium]|nr:methyltransferase domain-containing protein [Rhodobacterales bacterium]